MIAGEGALAETETARETDIMRETEIEIGDGNGTQTVTGATDIGKEEKADTAVIVTTIKIETGRINGENDPTTMIWNPSGLKRKRVTMTSL